MINEEKKKVQDEAFDALLKNDFNGIFILPTGTGKSKVLIDCLKYLVNKYKYSNIWYLCNSTVLRDTDFVEELEKWGASELIPIVKRMCYKTAYKLKDNSIDILIADEFDFSLTEEYSKVYFNNTFKHKILTTAFIDKDKMDLSNKISLIVYNKTLQNAEDENVLNKSEYYYVNFLMSDEETKEYLKINNKITNILLSKSKLEQKLLLDTTNGNLDSYKDDLKKLKFIKLKLESFNFERKRFLNSLNSSAVICRKLMKNIYVKDENCKILTFCELTEQADKVCKYSYHGKDKDASNLNKFREDEIQSLSVCGKVNRGVNIKNIRYIIIESCNASTTQLTQRLGRGKRLDVNELLKVYFLVPCYYENGKLKYTKIKDWINNAAKKLDLKNAKHYRFSI